MNLSPKQKFALMMENTGSLSPDFTKDYYLQKSKRQKTVARVLLFGGLGISAIGGLVQLSHQNSTSYGFSSWDFNFTGTYIAVGGGLVALCSIPYFVSSSKNARKAVTMSFHNHPVFMPQQNQVVLKSQPTVSVRINF